MKPTPANRDLCPTAVFGPDAGVAQNLAERMRTAGIGAAILVSADEMLATVRNRYFCTMVVLGELANPDCLRFLDSLRGASPRSWLIVASDTVDESALDLAHRHGVDALIAMPIDTTELIRRIGALRTRSRPIL